MKKQKRAFPVFLLVFIVSTYLGFPEQKDQNVSAQMQVPSSHILLCPDINVISLTVRLVKTSVSSDGTQWDHISLEATLQNDGGMAIPNGTMLQGKLYQNETVLFYISAPANGLKAPGSRWTDSYNAIFRHGVKTAFTYAFLNIRGMKECKTTNNQASLTINEAALHANVILRR
jgi:hypothetical protein